MVVHVAVYVSALYKQRVMGRQRNHPQPFTGHATMDWDDRRDGSEGQICLASDG